VTKGVLKIVCRIWEVGVVIGRRRGAFSTLLRQSGLRASTGGVLATKSERKMLVSICLYSLYAWLAIVVLGLVSSVIIQDIGWEEHLRNDLFGVECDAKP